jgi:hypothetical protein
MSKQVVITSSQLSLEAIEAFAQMYNNNLNDRKDRIDIHHVSAEEHFQKVQMLIGASKRGSR